MKKVLALLLALALTLGMFSMTASALATDGPVAPISDDVGTIICTGWPATTLNWILYYLLFGWFWMWHIPYPGNR